MATKINALTTPQNKAFNQKVFCIGLNKTGTTSLEQFMRENGFKCGDQAEGELLINAYTDKRWDEIVSFCNSAEFFQDLPFSAPKTAEVLLKKFPDAKYILTIRESAEVWYKSITEFHKIKFGKAGNLPTKADLNRALYRYKGFAWDANRALYDSPEKEPYQKVTLIKAYEDHIHNVNQLFKGKQNLLIIDIGKRDAVQHLNNFLGIKSNLNTMPWLNKTSEAKK